jgi:hypothetical protein
MTTIDTITDEQIITLGEEAGCAGDLDMVAICERAIDGDDEARAECVEVIRDAEAQREAMIKNLPDFAHADEDAIDAIRRADAEGWDLNLYADPEQDGAELVDIDDAIDAARIDPGLVYLTRCN